MKAGGYIKPYGEIVVGGPQTGRAGSEDSPDNKNQRGFLNRHAFPTRIS